MKTIESVYSSLRDNPNPSSLLLASATQVVYFRVYGSATVLHENWISPALGFSAQL